MHSGFLGSPFAIASAALSDTNVTDIARIFNDTNITSTSNFSFEPKKLLFVNYPEAIIHGPFASGGWQQSQTTETNVTNGTSSSNDTVAGLNITEALQISVNMTVTRPLILEQPLFAVNGSVDDNLNETYVVAVVDLGNTTTPVPPVAHYIGANYTANMTMGRLSVLTNSTPALLEYTPVDFVFGPDPNRFAFLIFQQDDAFNATGLNFTDPLVAGNFSISDFMNNTGLDDPIGGTMVWVAPCANPGNLTESSISSFTWSMSWGFNASATYQWGASGFTSSSSGFTSGFSNAGNGEPGSCNCGPWNGGMMPVGVPSSLSPQITGLSGSSPTDGTPFAGTSSVDGSSPTNALPTDGSVPTGTSSLDGTSTTDTSHGSSPIDGSFTTDGSTRTDSTLPTDGTTPTDGISTGGTILTDGSFPTDGSSPTGGSSAADGSFPFPTSPSPSDGTFPLGASPTDGSIPSGGSPTDGPSPTDNSGATSGLPTDGSLPSGSPSNHPFGTNSIPNQSGDSNPFITSTGPDSGSPSGTTPGGPIDANGTAPDGSPTDSSPAGFNNTDSSNLFPSGTNTGLTGTSTDGSTNNNNEEDDGDSCPLNNGGSSNQNIETATATSTSVVTASPASTSLSPRWAKSVRNLPRRNLYKSNQRVV